MVASSPFKPANGFLEFADALFRQRSFGVVGPVVAALRGDGVAHEINLRWRHEGLM
jgi:hypothetical protein